MKKGTKSRRLALLVATLLTLAATSAGRGSGEGIAALFLQVGDAVIQFPSNMATHLRELSFARLDPTCTQCN